jgi:hypothetical protein
MTVIEIETSLPAFEGETHHMRQVKSHLDQAFLLGCNERRIKDDPEGVIEQMRYHMVQAAAHLLLTRTAEQIKAERATTPTALT